MKETNQIRLRLEFEGKEYECRVDMDVCIMIEERVLLHKLGERIAQGWSEIPQTHLFWVVYCLLYRAGARCTPDDIKAAAMSGELSTDTLTKVAVWVFSQTYGAGPRKDTEEDADPKT